LILDDFGLSRREAQDRRSFLEILEDRWGKTSSFVVAQWPFDTWQEVLGEPTVADAICDRLFLLTYRWQVSAGICVYPRVM